MPKIKLIKVHLRDRYDYYTQGDIEDAITESISDWQEVTDEELSILNSWQGKNLLTTSDAFVVTAEDITHKVTEYIEDIKQFIKKNAEKVEAEKKKEQAIKDKKKADYEKRKIEKAKKILGIKD
jgi:hypothetical protein